MTYAKSAVLGLVLLLAWGCLNYSVIPLGDAPGRKPYNPDWVKVYLSERDIHGAFEKVAYIEVGATVTDTSTGALVDWIRERAAAVGANGVLLTGLATADDCRAGRKFGPVTAIAVFVKNR